MTLEEPLCPSTLSPPLCSASPHSHSKRTSHQETETSETVSPKVPSSLSVHVSAFCETIRAMETSLTQMALPAIPVHVCKAELSHPQPSSASSEDSDGNIYRSLLCCDSNSCSQKPWKDARLLSLWMKKQAPSGAISSMESSAQAADGASCHQSRGFHAAALACLRAPCDQHQKTAVDKAGVPGDSVHLQVHEQSNDQWFV